MHTLEVAIGRDGAGWRAQALQIDHGCEGNSPGEARLTFRRTLEARVATLQEESDELKALLRAPRAEQWTRLIGGRRTRIRMEPTDREALGAAGVPFERIVYLEAYGPAESDDEETRDGTESDKRTRRYFTNRARQVFGLRNLDQQVKGALFARYSRSSDGLRDVFRKEFAGSDAEENGATGAARASALYERVLGEYGDDSVAQLGSAHIACEGVSNVLTKVIERGRLMSYLEQSTRYTPYTERVDGRWKYVTPTEIVDGDLRSRYESAMDGLFETYSRWLPAAKMYWERQRPRGAGENPGAYRRAIQAKALDTLRGLLPAATRSNVGIHGSGQAFEGLLMRLATTELAEAGLIAGELRDALDGVLPDFIGRLDRKGRRRSWEDYLRERRQAEEGASAALGQHNGEAPPAEEGAYTRLVEHDSDGEARVIAAATHLTAGVPLAELGRRARELPEAARRELILTLAGTRRNRRHRPGRAFEHTAYTFELSVDYGAFRDLQRHRMLTMDWERLSTRRGRTTPAAIEEMGAGPEWATALDRAAEAHERVAETHGDLVAQYAVPMAYRIGMSMRMNAREAMHVLELRTQPSGHPAYRAVCQELHRLIRDEAGHRAIAEAMCHVNHEVPELERMAAEERTAGYEPA